MSISRRRFIAAGLAFLCVPKAEARDLAFLPLHTVALPMSAWRDFCRRNSWAGGQPSVKLPSKEDWTGIAEAVDAEVDRAPYRDESWFPKQLPKSGEAVNCVGSAVRKMGLLVLRHGFPPGDARVIFLGALGPGHNDHAALLLRFREGDYLLDNIAPQARPGLEHWSTLARQPLFITEAKDRVRTVLTRGHWPLARGKALAASMAHR